MKSYYASRCTLVSRSQGLKVTASYLVLLRKHQYAACYLSRRLAGTPESTCVMLWEFLSLSIQRLFEENIHLTLRFLSFANGHLTFIEDSSTLKQSELTVKILGRFRAVQGAQGQIRIELCQSARIPMAERLGGTTKMCRFSALSLLPSEACDHLHRFYCRVWTLRIKRTWKCRSEAGDMEKAILQEKMT